ncbi:hypothetical protein [Asanoa siamensis]|uniref:LPXTG-motif cell wall-anchored protein n=1 Tax=Asanoa siamensis TaxID=926357 RepID=A0ABQ4D3J0_9ACTN|nr:hypothetical protein [Asanoa siamensis]GIF78106.1 hypothetical protein Asi02nite_76240 [Asanoa siamensis]
MTLWRTAAGVGAAALTLALAGGSPAAAIEVTTVTAAGATATIAGGDAKPDTTVVVTASTGSGPHIDVASCGATVDEAGTWSCDLTKLGLGEWTLSAAGTDASGAAETTALRGFLVGPGGPATDPRTLATTGTPRNLPLAAAGAGLLALGVALLYRRSRTRRAA